MNLAALEAEAKSVFEHFASGLKIAQALPTVQAIEARFGVNPSLVKVVENAVAAAPSFVGNAINDVESLIAKGPALFLLSKALNVHPADQAFFDKLDASRGSQE